MRVVLSWSSGKDSAWTLYQLQRMNNVEVVGLLTTVNQEFKRVAMHAVREQLLEMQAAAAQLSLFKVSLPWPCSNDDYESRITAAIQTLKDQYSITHIAFGDLFLEDIKQYRINLLQGSGISPLFPIWQQDTAKLADKMIASGLSAYLTCVDPKQLSAEFAGRRFDSALLSELPAAVDRCGEKGEFHTFVNDGPMFTQSIPVQTGEIVHRDDFVFSDITLLQ